MNAIDELVNHPPHYTWLKGCEVIDVIAGREFEAGCVGKYLLRAPFKHMRDMDLKKAGRYAEWMRLKRQGEQKRAVNLVEVANQLGKHDESVANAFFAWTLAVRQDDAKNWENVEDYIKRAIELRI